MVSRSNRRTLFEHAATGPSSRPLLSARHTTAVRIKLLLLLLSVLLMRSEYCNFIGLAGALNDTLQNVKKKKTILGLRVARVDDENRIGFYTVASRVQLT